MGILLTITTVIFVILCVLLIIVILLQSDKSAGMGILGGSSQSAFGSSTADVITKITGAMVGIFLVLAMTLAWMESRSTATLEQKIHEAGDDEEDGINAETRVPSKTADRPGSEGPVETNTLNRKTK